MKFKGKYIQKRLYAYSIVPISFITILLTVLVSVVKTMYEEMRRGGGGGGTGGYHDNKKSDGVLCVNFGVKNAV